MPFDVNDILSTETTEAGSTDVVLVEPKLYTGQLNKFGKAKQMKDEDGALEPRLLVDAFWKIIDPTGEVAKVTNKDENFVKQTLWIDVKTNDKGEVTGYDWGTNKNTELARMRELFEQNDKGKPWALKNLLGQIAGINVVHIPDKKKPGVIYAQVGSVVARPS